jgi:hypothetical protein
MGGRASIPVAMPPVLWPCLHPCDHALIPVAMPSSGRCQQPRCIHQAWPLSSSHGEYCIGHSIDAVPPATYAVPDSAAIDVEGAAPLPGSRSADSPAVASLAAALAATVAVAESPGAASGEVLRESFEMMLRDVRSGSPSIV